MIKYIKAAEIIDFPSLPVIDVRTPAEYAIGHIPGAVNLPIFSDKEREAVGTRYHNAGKDAGFLLGLELVGPKLAGFVKKLNALSPSHSPVILYCWRGGMRSESMAWLFEHAGRDTFVINGGYKAFRSYIREVISTRYNFIVVGGMTGAGKTEYLHELRLKGEQVIDLEGLANHKGSVFGHMGLGEQPTNETFENMLWHELQQMDPDRVIYIEDESRSIGKVSIPEEFYRKMLDSPLQMLDTRVDVRVERLLREYGSFDKELLISNIDKLSKYIGGENHARAVEAVESGKLELAVRILLTYYDKKYSAAISRQHSAVSDQQSALSDQQSALSSQ